MSMVWTAALWVAALLGICGWAAAIGRRLSLHMELALPMAICTTGLIVYTAGLCGSLAVGAFAAMGAGILLGVWTLIRHPEDGKQFAAPWYILLALFLLYIAWQVHDDRLSHNDDFNHWAVMVKNLLLADRFPDASATAIDFSSYPPMTAVMVYYFNRIACGHAAREGMMIYAQNTFVLLMLSPVFAVLRKEDGSRHRAWSLTAMLSAAVLLIFLYEFRALIVDVPNGIVGAAAVLGVLILRDDPKKAAVYAMPVMCAGLLIKYSNAYFAAPVFLALCWVNIRAKREGRPTAWGLVGVWFGFCAVMVIAWFLHVRAAFGGVADTHSMNAGRIRDVVAGWSKEDIRTIAKVCVYYATNLTKSSVLLTAFMNAAAIGLAVVNKLFFRRPAKRLIGSVAMADLFYVGYQIMLFTAYVLSFPRDEALRGASYGRYNMSVMIWVIAFLSYECAGELIRLGAEKKAKVWRAVFGAGFALVTAVALMISGEGATLWNEVPYEGTKQFYADRILEENDFTDEDSFLVLAADEDSKQVASVFHYKTNRHVDNVYIEDIESLQELAETASAYDYLIVLEEDERLETLVGMPGVYTAEQLTAMASEANN